MHPVRRISIRKIETEQQSVIMRARELLAIFACNEVAKRTEGFASAFEKKLDVPVLERRPRR
jgi:hypothetical protein